MIDQVITKNQAPISQVSKNPFPPKSWGERLSLLLVIVMECCLVSAVLLVQVGLSSGVTDPLLPIWAVFLISFCLYWFARGVKRLTHQKPGAHSSLRFYRAQVKLMMGCATLICLVLCLWLRFYAQHYLLFDLAWLQAFSYDLWQFDSSLQIVVLGLVICMIAWLSYQMVEERADAALLLRKGGPLLFLLAGIGLGEHLLGSNPDYWQVFLLLPVFFWSGLTSQALQKASAKRRYYSVGLEGGTQHQEQIIFQVMLLLALIALPAVVVIVQMHGNSVLAHPTPHTGLDPLLPLKAKDYNPAPEQVQVPQKLTIAKNTSVHFTPGIILLDVVVGVLVLGLAWFCIFFCLRQLKKRPKKEKQDEIKSLWSWSLFLAQFKALLRPFFSLPKRWCWRSGDRGILDGDELQLTALEVRTMREVYQAFLHRAMQRGYRRELDETPREFRSRLYSEESQSEPELGVITETYMLVRYGGVIPRQEEIAQIKGAWRELDQKWKQES